MQRHPRPPAVGQRPDLVVRAEDGVQVRRAAEERQLGQVGLPVPAVRGRIDQPGPPVGAQSTLPGHRSPCSAGRRFARRVPVHDVDDHCSTSATSPPDSAPRRPRSSQVRQQPALARTRSPRPGGRGVVLRQRTDEAGPVRRRRRRRPGAVQRGQLAAERSAAAGVGEPGSTHSIASMSGSATITSGTGTAPAARSQVSPAASAAKKPARRRPGRPRLGEDRRAVVQGQAGRGAHVAARHRGLPDALMGEKCREMLGVRAQVRQIHGLIFHFGLRRSGFGVKMSA